MKKTYNKYNNFPPKVSGISVEVQEGRFEQALRMFKRKVQDAGILREARERQHYETPTMKRKKARQMAKKRWIKKQTKLQKPTRKY